MFQSLCLERLIRAAEIHDVEWTQGPQCFKVFANSLHHGAGDGLRPKNPNVDVGTPVRHSGRFRPKYEKPIGIEVEKLLYGRPDRQSKRLAS